MSVMKKKAKKKVSPHKEKMREKEVKMEKDCKMPMPKKSSR